MEKYKVQLTKVNNWDDTISKADLMEFSTKEDAKEYCDSYYAKMFCKGTKLIKTEDFYKAWTKDQIEYYLEIFTT